MREVYRGASGTQQRDQRADALHRLFEVDRFRLEGSALAWHESDAYRASIDFSEVLIALVNEEAGCEDAASFYRRACRLDQTRLLAR